MSWESILPIVTLLLGFLGSLHVESRRDRKERERVAITRIAETEYDAVLKLHELLLQLRQEHAGLRRMRRSADEVRIEDSAPLIDVSIRATTLASRIVDDELRRAVLDVVEPIDEYSTLGEMLTWLDSTEPQQERDNLVRAIEGLGRRLRTPII